MVSVAAFLKGQSIILLRSDFGCRLKGNPSHFLLVVGVRILQCMKHSLGLFELYARNPEEADRKLWGREVDPESRRGFLRKAGLVAMGTALGAPVVFASHMPSGLIPAGLMAEQ